MRTDCVRDMLIDRGLWIMKDWGFGEMAANCCGGERESKFDVKTVKKSRRLHSRLPSLQFCVDIYTVAYTIPCM